MISILFAIGLAFQSDPEIQEVQETLGLPLTCTPDTVWFGINSEELQREGVPSNPNASGFEFHEYVNRNPSYSRMSPAERVLQRAFPTQDVWRVEVETFDWSETYVQWVVYQVGGGASATCGYDYISQYVSVLNAFNQSPHTFHCTNSTNSFIYNPDTRRFVLSEISALTGPTDAGHFPIIRTGRCSPSRR